MILVDTSVWIEYFRFNPEYHQPIMQRYQEQEIVGVGCVFAELLQGARTEPEALLIEEHWKTLPKLAEGNLWVEAGRLSFEGRWVRNGVGVVDSFLVALTREHRVKLWTLDKKLKSVLKSSEIFEL